jgi:transglutaminase-like putative cysteine protease
MRYRVRHVTDYSYDLPVDLAAHMLLLTPRALPHQRVEQALLQADPLPARRSEAKDHFGNPTTRLFLDVAHARFTVAAESTVEVRFPDPPAFAATPAWEQVAAAARQGGGAAAEAAEFAFDSPFAAAAPGPRDYALPSFPPGRPVLAGLRDLLARMARDFTFRAGVTTISTPVAEVLARRAGVCQDFAHLMIAALRGLGLPARYVSGYIRTRPPPGGMRRRGADQSHAWVGAWLGPALGWVDLDPTNDLIVRDEHIVLGWGRDFGDVSPLRGVILGGGEHGLRVGVDVDPL